MRTVRIGLALLAFWCVVVPPQHASEVVVGLAAAASLAVFAESVFGMPHATFGGRLRWRLLPGFAGRTMLRVTRSAWQVQRIALGRRVRLSPVVVTREEIFDDEAQRVFYANLITLTPGTLTVELDGDRYEIHCLDPALARDVLDGRLANEVRRLLGAPR